MVSSSEKDAGFDIFSADNCKWTEVVLDIFD